VDGHVIPKSVAQIYAEGNQAKIPVLIGWNKDDNLFVRPQSPETFKTSLNDRFGTFADKFAACYRSADDKETLTSQKRMSRDETFGLQMYHWALNQAGNNGTPAYVYNFNRTLPAYNPETEFGAFHSGEIVYAYNNLHTLDRPWEEEDVEVTRLMSGYWVNFIKFGNPNGPGLPQWPEFNADKQEVMILDARSEAKTLPDRDVFELWKTFDIEAPQN
jgi:para-nitrobenzyl esterase